MGGRRAFCSCCSADASHLRLAHADFQRDYGMATVNKGTALNDTRVVN